jgi:hypothetical protein
VVYRAAHVGGLDDRAILFEQALMVAEMVGIDLEEVSYERKTFRTGNLSDWLTIYRDGDWVLVGQNL